MIRSRPQYSRRTRSGDKIACKLLKFDSEPICKVIYYETKTCEKSVSNGEKILKWKRFRAHVWTVGDHFHYHSMWNHLLRMLIMRTVNKQMIISDEMKHWYSLCFLWLVFDRSRGNAGNNELCEFIIYILYNSCYSLISYDLN